MLQYGASMSEAAKNMKPASTARNYHGTMDQSEFEVLCTRCRSEARAIAGESEVFVVLLEQGQTACLGDCSVHAGDWPSGTMKHGCHGADCSFAWTERELTVKE